MMHAWICFHSLRINSRIKICLSKWLMILVSIGLWTKIKMMKMEKLMRRNKVKKK